MGAISIAAKAAKAAKKAAAIAKRKAAIAESKSKTKKAKESINDYENEVAGTRERSGFTGKAEKDIEQGKAGKVTTGKKSVPSFADQETSNKNRVTRNKRVSDLETKKTRGTITAEEKVELARLDKLSSDQDKSRASKAASTASSNARKGKGVSLADGASSGKKVTVGKVEKQPSGNMIGDTKNGINKNTGEIFGKPTINQVNMAIRDLEARDGLRASAKKERLRKYNKLLRDLRQTKEQRQGSAIAKLERNMVDTGKDKSGRNYSKGGMSKKRMSYNKGGYVNCGASMPATQGKK